MAATRPDLLSRSQARRLVLRASGLDAPRPQRAVAGTRALQQVVDRLGLLQVDSVNVLARAHLVPVYARVGPWDVGTLDRATGRAPRRLVETWAHEASLVPAATFRHLAFKHAENRARIERRGDSMHGVPVGRSPEVARVRAVVDELGPVTAREVQTVLGGDGRRAEAWGWAWTDAKRALEHLFVVGELTSAGRNAQFERRYDRPDRVLPADVLAAPALDEATARRHLVEVAARAHGVVDVRCLADHWRTATAPTRTAVDELVEEGVLLPVEVEGWRGPLYRHRDATVPRRARGRTLLSPFDPLVWERTRTEALFGLRYRIEIYVPAAARVWGYYVLPFLLGERFVALIDLKADRRAGALRVHAVHRAPGPAAAAGTRLPADAEVAHELAAELWAVADWLGLSDVHVPADAAGDLVGPLARALVPALV
ncbi:winged helix-turn-helix domain-containing protein [Cellulomonas wangsupingiae]|uniref:winged helix-turn-helix domain-containing protein n=1 Tax=Cellulomonas wangsupingiae TaxID=2968085 RepID=UPI001D0E42D7|nr:crosslink repair DNA glycosylase YcaQ family protein [Cellulomonas wangsupingiae]MCM0640275.1 winged helix DNA-binding domain-containing protein [Cellulomonas wangsupingiae]